MTIKAIIMDIDGTLVDQSQSISPRTKAVLLAAQDSGIKLVLASGRPVNGMLGLARELEMDRNHGICVCFNGSRAVDVQTGQVLFDQAMDVETGRAVLHHMKNFDVQPLIVKGEYAYVTDVYKCMVHMDGMELNIMNHESHENGYKLCEVDDLEAFVDYPLNKILNIGEPEYLKAHYEEMRAPFEGRLNAMFTAPFYYEFTDLGIDKAKALDTVLGGIGIASADTIAFGDAQNDKTMLEYAGIGVAMGNAVEELKAVADEVTASCTEDGIACTLEKYL